MFGTLLCYIEEYIDFLRTYFFYMSKLMNMLKEAFEVSSRHSKPLIHSENRFSPAFTRIHFFLLKMHIREKVYLHDWRISSNSSSFNTKELENIW